MYEQENQEYARDYHTGLPIEPQREVGTITLKPCQNFVTEGVC
jgi:hypothetical protein